MATMEPNQQSEILSFVTKFLELTSRGHDVELQIVQKNGEISVNMCTNLKNLLMQPQTRTSSNVKPSRIRRRKRREEARQLQSRSNTVDNVARFSQIPTSDYDSPPNVSTSTQDSNFTTLDEMYFRDDIPLDDLPSPKIRAESVTLGNSVTSENVLQYGNDYRKHCSDMKSSLGREDFERYLAYFNASIQEEIARLHKSVVG